MFGVLDQCYIKDCLGYFIINNTITNNCMVTSVLEELFQRNKNSYDSLQYCLRCNGHIINLSLQVFLFKSLPEKVTLNDRKSQDESFYTA